MIILHFLGISLMLNHFLEAFLQGANLFCLAPYYLLMIGFHLNICGHNIYHQKANEWILFYTKFELPEFASITIKIVYISMIFNLWSSHFKYYIECRSYRNVKCILSNLNTTEFKMKFTLSMVLIIASIISWYQASQLYQNLDYKSVELISALPLLLYINFILISFSFLIKLFNNLIPYFPTAYNRTLKFYQHNLNFDILKMMAENSNNFTQSNKRLYLYSILDLNSHDKQLIAQVSFLF